MTIPELGTIEATHPPVIVLTSNRTRDLHDAVKRRCLYHWIDYPRPQREVEIVRRRVKGASETLAVQVADAVSRMRDSDVQKPPGIAEAIDWLAALELLGIEALDEAAIGRTLGSVLKYAEDQEVIRAAGLDRLVQPRMTRLRRRDRSTSTCRRSRPRSRAACTRRACPSRPSARPPSRARSTSSARSPAAGCTGPPAPSSSPTRPTCAPSTRRSRRSSGRRIRAVRRTARSPRPSRRATTRRSGAGGCERGRRGGRGAAGRRRRRGAARHALASTRWSRDELAQLYRLMTRLELAPPAAPHAPPRARARPARSTCGGRCATRGAAAASRCTCATAAAASSAAGWCCCATSRARWSPTPAPTCSCSPRPPPPARARRPSSSPPGSPASPARCRPPPRARDRARRRGGARLVERHPDRAPR